MYTLSTSSIWATNAPLACGGMHQQSFSHGCDSFFERLAHGLVGHRPDRPKRDEAVGEQAQTPPCPSLRGRTAGQRDQVRLAGPVELGRVRPLGGARVERQVKPLLHEQQPDAAHRARAHVQRPGDPLVRPAGAALRHIRFEQDARVRYCARRRFPATGHLLQQGALLGG